VEGSVLWLFEDNLQVADNLRREAVQRGIESSRLVFAQRMPLAEHLARHRSADLFLDTLPCNAHTTASDALWAGLPLLTLTGESFASRVAASLLNAIHLSELITSTQEEYEALAIELATNPEKLGKIRQKLAQNRFTTPLFDTKRFTRNLEQVYCMMYERSQQELPPAHLFSLPSAQGGTGTIQPLQQEYACCPLCGGKSALRCRADCSRHSLWHEPLPRILEWMRCTNCHHVYTRHFWTQAGIDELFRNAHQNQLAGFGASQDAKRANWVPVVDKVLNLLGGYRSIMDNGSHPTWVDVGCGDGALAMTASDYGFSALGLDARSEAVRRIIELGFKAQESDFMQCTFEHKLDVLSMMDVLEHMPYPGLALGKAAELVRPGGILVISLPDLSCSSWRMMDAAKSNPYWMEIEHHHNFSRERLIALLGERGFGVADFGIPHRYKAQMELYAVRKNLFM
jgi:SAM-dependent methyltransferase